MAMLVYRAKGIVDAAALRVELQAALGPPASNRWWPVFDPSEAVITYDDKLFDRAAIANVAQSHISRKKG